MAHLFPGDQLMLYIFAEFPTKNQSWPGDEHLHGGGLQYCIEMIEELAVLEHDPNIQYRTEGVFTPGENGEWLRDFDCRISRLCLQTGITWSWFPENWSFGNGVTVHKTLASPEFRSVIHGTGLSLDRFLELHGPTRLADLEMVRKHNRHESWEKYEARWIPGTCPQDNHIVHLTWMVTTHKLPEFAYERIRQLIEEGAEPRARRRYSPEPGKHFSEVRRYDGKPVYGEKYVLPVS